jgi:hypothetical protein
MTSPYHIRVKEHHRHPTDVFMVYFVICSITSNI